MSDEVIWHCLRHNHCSFMAKIETGLFCRNPYNATGICNRSSCPLANSRYATIRDHDGIFYLYMKTAERAHLPNKLWERVKLPKNYLKAMEVIEKHLQHWPELLVHKIKQRLTKMTQYRIRMRNLQLKVREKIMTVPRKKTQRDRQRLENAEKAAQLEKSIESELIERLRKGVYGGKIHNVPFKQFDTILDMENVDLAPEIEEDEEGEIEYVEGADIEMDEMEDMEDFKGFGAEDDDGDEDDGLDEPSTKKPKGSGYDLRSKIGRKSTKIITEVEQDEDRQTKDADVIHQPRAFSNMCGVDDRVV